MEDTEQNPRTRMRWPFYVALVVLLVPVVYLLSIGPAAWLLVNGYLTDDTMDAIYAPLEIVAEVIPETADWINWYVDLWGYR